MTKKIYNWKRYWYPTNKQPPLWESGFLRVPDESDLFFRQDNKGLATFEAINDCHCLVLLGEPGMGKSQAIDDACDFLNNFLQQGYDLLPFKLAKYGDENRLIQKLFQSNIFQNWLTGSHNLYLFLDELDEARLKIDTITHRLIDELSNIQHALPRLFLRIACRTSDWSQEFEVQLRELYGREQVSVYKLAPLQIRDAKEAVEAQNIQWDIFWREIQGKDIGPLAANPITLRLLLAQYDRIKGLPRTRREIYQKGCEKLCIEEKERHQQRDNLDAEQRFEIAARIAACMIFANYQDISTDDVFSEGADNSLVFSDITDPPGVNCVESLPVHREGVKETLETALFQGSTLKTWIHRTFSEFMAAWYVDQHLSVHQIQDLLFLNGSVVPQLREVGAWLASLNHEIWSAIMESDPELLLRSDITKDEDQLKAKWVESILHKHAVSAVLDYNPREWYKKLKHSNLPTQLRPFLENIALPINVRIEAAEIAAACNEQSLQDSLVAIALDASESMELREEATYALANIADSSTRAHLKGLALLPILDAETRNLKEHALRCAWPDHITIAELLDSIDLHYKQDHEYSPNEHERDIWDIGTYLPGLLEQNVNKLDIIACLRWVECQPKSHVLPFAYQNMIDIIMVSAWEQIEHEQVADAFADAVLSRVYLYDSIVPGRSVLESDFYAKILQNERHRQQTLRRMLLRISTRNHNADRLIGANTPFIAQEDISFCIQEFSASASSNVQANWAQILQILLIREVNIEQVAYIYNVCETHPVLDQALDHPFNAVSVESKIAQVWRQRRAERERYNIEKVERPVRRPPMNPSPVSRVLQYLTECEMGKHESWYQISYWMMAQADGYEEWPHLEDLPVWQELTVEQRERVVQTAKGYILNFVPKDTQWLKETKYSNNNLYYPSIVAGYRAFYLLLAKEQAFVSSLPDENWQRWGTIILYYSWSAYRRATADQGDLKLHQELLHYAYQYASEPIIASILLIIELDSESSVESLLRWVKFLLNSELVEAIVEKVKDEALKPPTMYTLLLYTLQQDNAKAKQYAESLVNQLQESSDNKFTERSVLAARALLKGSKDAGWQAVWPSFQLHPEFGKQVLGWILHDYDRYPRQHSYLQEKLTESQLVDFYIWLCQQFPLDKDWRWGGRITQLDEFARFRDATLYVLQQRDPKLALNALQEIDTKLPHNDSVRWRLAEVRDRLQRDLWQPPPPSQVIELVRNRKARWIRTGSQLLEIISALLDTLERKLQGQNPAVVDLWNSVKLEDDKASSAKRKTSLIHTPKDEESFSDYVARFLSDRLSEQGIFIGREVQARRGSYTDIWIETFVRLPNNEIGDRITAIIEVKGCWHKEVETAMKTQLVERYMQQNGYYYGIYLIGWFRCAKWEEDNFSKRDQSGISYTYDEAKTKFFHQAKALSQNGLDVRTFILDSRLS